MDSESRIIEVVLCSEFSDYDRRTGDTTTRPFARPRKVTVYDSLDRLADASERTAIIYSIILLKSVCLSVGRRSQTAGRNSCSIVSGNVSNCSYRLTVRPVTSSCLSSA